jgi:hypothetical protein
MKLTPKLWTELEKLNEGPLYFERWTVGISALVPLADARLIVPLRGADLAEARLEARNLLAELLAKARQALDAGAFGEVRHLMGTALYVRDLDADDNDGEPIWFMLSDAGTEALIGHQARKRKPTTKETK